VLRKRQKDNDGGKMKEGRRKEKVRKLLSATKRQSEIVPLVVFNYVFSEKWSSLLSSSVRVMERILQPGSINAWGHKRCFMAFRVAVEISRQNLDAAIYCICQARDMRLGSTLSKSIKQQSPQNSSRIRAEEKFTYYPHSRT
jgi:hypothetical protein